MIDTIYLDMDGVITDFIKGAKDGGYVFNDENKKTKIDWEALRSEGAAFWQRLEWTKEGKKLYNWLDKYCKENNIELCILSSVDYSEGVLGKRNWLRNNKVDIPMKNVYLVSKNNKHKYAEPNSLLIDDFKPNCDQFIAKGGKAIQYTNLDDLKEKIVLLK